MPRAERLLVAGAVLGAILAVVGLRPPADPFPFDAVAVIGDTVVPVSAYQRALSARQQDQPDVTLGEAERTEVLSRVIDEALLVRHGVALGLAHTDPRARALMVTAVLDLWAAEARDAAGAPDEATLRAFYEAHPARFTMAPRVSVQAWWFQGPHAATRAEQVKSALQAGEVVTSDPAVLPLPEGPVRSQTLVNYLGVDTLAAVQAAPDGVASGPYALAGAHVLFAGTRTESDAPAPLATVLPAVEEAWRKEREEQNARAHLDRLRTEFGVEIREEAL
jgi:hypothetical protein